MMEVSIAHLLMLIRQQIVDENEGRKLLEACRQVAAAGPDEVEYDARFEDLFFVLEHKLSEMVGDEAVGNMHVALSRNDLDTTMYRMALRDELLQTGETLAKLRKAVLDVASQHAETVMPAYTHNQQAQPTTFAHYLAGIEAEFAKDSERLLAMWPRLNRSPMGAAALATSGYPVDRHYVATALGFDGLVENSYEAVASADFTAEYAAWALILLGHVSRFVTDLMFWVTNEVAAIKLHPSLIQVSSIMPQKRNPVALEHVRAFTTKAMGLAAAIVQQMHNVPYGDINDVNDDLQPSVRGLSVELNDILQLLTDIVATMEVDRQLLHRRSAEGFAAVTELADVLVRDVGLPFRTAHHVVSQVVERLTADGRRLLDLDLFLLDEIAQEVTGRPTGLSEEQLQRAVDPVHFVQVRSVQGGPAPDEMRRYLKQAGERLQQDESTRLGFSEGLNRARQRHEQAVDEMIAKGVARM